MHLKWKRLNARAELPKAATVGAAGFDFKAALDADLTVKPGEIVAIPTGLAVEVPHGCELQVRARSGLALKHGFCLVNGIGTIDSDYRGEIKVIATVLGREPLVVKSGDRIAQGVVATVTAVTHEESLELSATERGAGGFGSTGVA
ncbi:MAG: dUTP diphosphatase [Bdellovibrionales bacterium]|nr:dUTP diphosphatase [Bdellovibrionales bacterium]